MPRLRCDAIALVRVHLLLLRLKSDTAELMAEYLMVTMKMVVVVVVVMMHAIIVTIIKKTKTPTTQTESEAKMIKE